jgi:thiol:disulfide interchange protein DsbA
MNKLISRRSCTQLALFVPLLAVLPVRAAPLLLVEGQHYARLATPEAVSTGKKIEVLEVFSYGCVHCYEYEPEVRLWKQRQPKDVQVTLMPATFNSNFALYARGYYAAEALGVAGKLHEQVFDTIWKNKFAVADLNTLANLYLRLGVDHDKFLAAARSPGVDAALKQATDKAERLKLAGTPTFYVDGKYQLLTDGAASIADVMKRLDALIAKARFERK